MDEDALRQRVRDDEKLLRRAEKALTQIKVGQGLSEPNAAVLAALRIRLKGDPGRSLDELLTAAGDLASPDLEQMLEKGGPAEQKPKRSLDDILAQPPKPKPDWPGSS